MRPQIDAKTLYEKYAETFQRLRPNVVERPADVAAGSVGRSGHLSFCRRSRRIA